MPVLFSDWKDSIVATAMTIMAMLLPTIQPPEAQVTVVRHAKQECQTKKCEHRVARKQFNRHQTVLRRQCGRGVIQSCIYRAANLYRVSGSVLMRRAWCESRLSPGATNGRYMGLFQFGWTAWSITPYAGHSPYHPKWASLAAAWAEAHGYAHLWSCR